MMISFSYAVQVVLVVAAELALAKNVVLPGLDPRHDEWQQAQPVVGRQYGDAQHLAEHAQHEQRLQRGADLERLLRDLVTEQPVRELA